MRSSRAAAALAGVALCALGALPARAECETDGVALFPSHNAVIPTNAELILEGRGTAQEEVLALVGRTLTLHEDGGDPVTLQVRRGWKSDMNRVAVRLVPKGRLRPDARYRLRLDEVAPGLELLGRSGTTEVVWRTGAKPDRTRPRWTKLPGPSEGRYYLEDDKLHRQIRFNLALEDKSPLYMVVSLKRARGKAPRQTYFAPISSAEVWLGHDGCSGGFTFDDGRAYLARFDVYDAAGNRARRIRRIEFQAPKPGTR